MLPFAEWTWSSLQLGEVVVQTATKGKTGGADEHGLLIRNFIKISSRVLALFDVRHSIKLFFIIWKGKCVWLSSASFFQTSVQQRRSKWAYTRRYTALSLSLLILCGGMRLSALGKSVNNCPFVPASDEYEALGGMRIGRGNRSILRKFSKMPLCPPQIQLGLAWGWNRNAALGSRWLTAWTMARSHVVLHVKYPLLLSYFYLKNWQN
jgi:hypothetical protein